MDVSVIIVTYNTLRMTNECISSIVEKTTDVSYEIILVDNASKDGSKDFFSSDNRITYIYNDENFGFGKANNIGAKVAKGKYLFFLNSDTYFLNNALFHFFKHAEENNSNVIGFWGTQLKDKEGNVNGNGSTFPSIRKSLMLAAHIKPKEVGYREEPFEPYFVDYVLGADMFTSKHVFDELGGFDEDFFMYYEESDIMRRGARLGYFSNIIYGPSIVHLEGKSNSSTTSHPKRMIIEKSHMLHLKKHYSILTFSIFLVIYILIKHVSFLNTNYKLKENCQYISMLWTFLNLKK